MTIELRPLAELDPDAVAATLAETVQRVTEDNPQIDVRRGVFAELLCYYHAVLDTQRRANIQDYENGRSLAAIQADPILADPSLVDDVLSNFGLDRKAGRNAAGEVTVIMLTDTTVTIGEGAVWEARGRSYVTTQAFTAKAEEGQINSDGDRLFTETVDGKFAFTIEVIAAEVGTDYNVTKDTLVVPLVVPQGYVTSFAAGDFTEGLAEETNDELLVRLQEGIAAKTLSNRVNMAATLRTIEEFSRVTAMSIVGYGDGELVRAWHSILPIALSGRCDWYIRTQETVLKTNLNKTATLLTINNDTTGVWQISVTRDDAPGFYEFTEVRPLDVDPSQGGYTITEDNRGFDLTGDGFRPDIINAVEAAYTAFSTSVIYFTDTTDHTSLTVGDTREYQLTAACMPLIAEIQEHVSSRDVRPYGGDCLVKAPVPVFLQLHFTINKRTGQADPDLDAIKAALSESINTIGFVGTLWASQIQDVIHNYLTNGQTVSAIDMHGRIRYPDGSITYLRDSELLEIPDDAGNMVTAQTAQFYTDAESIEIAVVTSIPTAL